MACAKVKVNALGPKSLMQAQIKLLEQVKPCSCSALMTHGRRVKADPPPLGGCCSSFPASASLVLGCSPKMPKHTDPAFTSGPKLFPASAGPMAVRHEGLCESSPTSGHIWAQHQELSTSWPQPSCSPMCNCSTAKREMPKPGTLSGKQNKCHLCARD